jgi:hypothetical protein
MKYLVIYNKHSFDKIIQVHKRIQTFVPASGKPTRNKIGKMFTEFVSNCFTPEGEYNKEGNYPALKTKSCKYCPYLENYELCPKDKRIKVDET